MATKKPNYTLVNGEEMHQLHPTKFDMPDRSERTTLTIGSFVKCIFQDGHAPSERMWVIVREAMPDGTYKGELNNHPIEIKAKAGDIVLFSPEHVIDILN